MALMPDDRWPPERVYSMSLLVRQAVDEAEQRLGDVDEWLSEPGSRGRWIPLATRTLQGWAGLVDRVTQFIRDQSGASDEISIQTVVDRAPVDVKALFFQVSQLERAALQFQARLQAARLAAGEPVTFSGYDVLGEALKLLRKDAGKSQDDVAEFLHASRAMVSHVEAHRKKIRVTLEMVEDWALACGRNLTLQFRALGAAGEREDLLGRIASHLDSADVDELRVVEKLARGLKKV